MNTLFRRLALPVKLTLIGLVPFILLLIVAIQLLRAKSEKLDVIKSYQTRVGQAANLSNLIDQLQSERRYSFGYTYKQTNGAEMVLERSRVNDAIARVEQENGGNLKDFKSYTFLTQLAEMRTRIDKKSVFAADVMSFYTSLIFRLNTINNVAAGNVLYLQPVTDDLIGQKLLSEMITYLGMNRASIYLMLDTRQATPEGVAGVRQVSEIFNSYAKEMQIRSFASYKAYMDIQNDPDVRYTLHYIDKIRNTGALDTTLTSDLWWARSASGVDNIRKLQRSMLSRLKNGVETINVNEMRSRNLTAGLVIAMLALVVFFIAYVIRQISRVLGDLRAAADDIALGRSGLRLPIETNDVVGALTRSILAIDVNNQKLAAAAAEIGKGNFEVPVHPRSGDDALGNAIVRMKTDLQLFTTANERTLWLQTGRARINEALLGEKTVDILGRDILAAIVSYTGCDTGIFYEAREKFLALVATHAITDPHLVPRHISFGTRLTGQAAEKQEAVVLRDMPDSYWTISSASGGAQPREGLILPLVQNGVVEGVIELASLHEISEPMHQFLRDVNSDIAIALQSAKSRARLQELFEETQAQAEELQAQHSELENMNTELEAQSNKLQASEEELRVQQEELQQTNEELEERSRLLEEKNQLIVERNLEIQRKAEELELSTKYKSEFLANMSHELRTPLNSILLLSRLLSENNEKNLSTDQVEYAQVIRNSGTSLLSLIDEILDLSKIEAGKMELEYATVSLAEMTEGLRSLFAPVAKDKGIGLEIERKKGLPLTIETDRMRLEQILKNLLSNALKFTSKGAVTLDVAPEPGPPARLAFTVRDTGIGIAPDKQALIFEAFQQEDGSTRRKYGGTGLGLSISRELAKLLGGEIRLVSEPGKGSEFTVVVPLARPAEKPVQQSQPVAYLAPEPDEQSPAEKRPSLRTSTIPANVPDDRDSIGNDDKCILIIEDDTNFARALLDFTRKQGYKGIVAVRGDDGIELARQFRPAGILLDIQLPVRDGWEVMDDLKSNTATRHIPVHMMSSLEARRESMMKGAIDFINKPVAFEQMQEVFRKIESVIRQTDKKVLIVEENAKHAVALSYFLETFDVTAQVSTSIRSSVDALKQEDVDCVILDMGIPDAKAYETLEEVKRQSGLENLPVIIFTGKSLSAAEESRIRQYADSIVVKTANSYQRVLDEVSLFLHLVEEGKKDEASPKNGRRLIALNDVLQAKKILVTDDDVRNIFSLTKALEAQGMEVYSAIDGREALLRLEEHPDLDVVLMDIMMPELDGYETMREIRRNPKHRQLPIIAVTAKAMTGDREKCIQAGASDYISKPVDVDQLLSLLRVWLYEKSS
jgi:signal transduction histidine kinase/CheY-like chemotaxis protein